MQNFNYHTHTFRCGHTDMSMSDEDYVKEHIKKGFTKMAFTDHAPQKEKIDKRLYMRMEYEQIDEYLNSINTLKHKYKGEIEIKTGFEIEYLPNQLHNLDELKRRSEILILGQHFVYNEDKSDLKVFRVDKFSDAELIRYANYISEAMELGLPDIVAHPDLFMLSSDCFGSAEEKATRIICASAEKTGIPLEINLGNIMFGKIHYPCKEFWEIASEYKLNVVYAIDAHNKEQIRAFEKTIEIATERIGKSTVDKLHFVTP